MISEAEFQDEVAGFVSIFIKASKALDDAAIDSQGKACARLITSLARSTTFEPWSDDVKCPEAASTRDFVGQLIEKMESKHGDNGKAAQIPHGEDAGGEGGQTGRGSPGSD